MTGNLTIGGTTNFGDFNITNVGSIALDTITNDGTDITLDSSGDIILDAAGNDIFFKAGGTTIGEITNSSSDLVIKSSVSDKDILIKGNDGGSAVTALTFDMSAAGAATFNNIITAVGTSVFTNLDISGDVDVDGTLETDALTIGGVTLAETISDTVGAMVSSNTETGITVSYEDGDNTLDFALGAAQTTITSLLATDIKIGEDDQTKIDFETADEIHFYAANVEQVYLGDNIFGPQSDSDVDLGSTGVRWKDAFVDTITVTGEIDGASLDISGNADIDGTLEADAITVDGVALATFVRDTVGGNMVSSNTETGITVTYDTSNDNLDFALNAAQTTITSLLATDIKIGEDDQTKIDFETADQIHFYAANASQISLADGVLNPVTDSDVDLGTSSLYYKNAYIDAILTTGNITSPSNIIISVDTDADDVSADSATGRLTLGAGEDLNLYHGGTHSYIVNDTGNLVIDTAGDLILDADGGDIFFKDGGTTFGSATNTSGNLILKSGTTTAATFSGANVTFAGTVDSGAITSTGIVTAVGTSVFTNLDISGDVDVDGTTNLDVVDIDGAVDMASTLAVAGAVTANAGVVVDNITIDGTEIDLSSGNLLIDVAGDIILDADGGDIILKDDGTEFGNIANSSSDFQFVSIVSDKDIIFRGNDGGSFVNALTLDMSAAGAATFNNDVTAFSDKRLKDNIETIPNALDKVCAMRGVTFTRNDNDGQPGTGVIAQEMQEVFPVVVKENNDELNTLSVSYGNLVGVLIEAVKELKEEIEKLKKDS